MGRGRPQFRTVRGCEVVALLTLLLIIMLSALKRMSLYVSAYGLTEQRLYATAFMLWLAVVFIWFAATVLRNRRNDFAFGAMVAGCALVAALNVFNADAFIVKVNVERRASGKVFDALYASSLSADAVPTLIGQRVRPDRAATVRDGIHALACSCLHLVRGDGTSE